MRKHRPVAERFWDKVEKTESCWLWRGSKTNKGYGEMNTGGDHSRNQNEFVHRLSWVLHFGPIPDGLNVLHHCDTPLCVRPDHLFLGTQADNMHDCKVKGRARGPSFKGEEHPMAKLTVQDVREIRGSAQSCRVMAARFNVVYTHISSIRRRKTWRHI